MIFLGNEANEYEGKAQGDDELTKQKLFIGVGLVKEILFLAQLGIGVTPYPDYRAR